jgi:2-oxoglutarate/2-oxoacid ferredoxin oxidoreductase subunit beta
MKYDVGKEKAKFNNLGYDRKEYAGAPSTLCPGCGHNSIANQIVAACFELDIKPEKIAKFSGIGCSSKSPNYFLNRSFGFNGLHGRMPSLALGALFADTSVRGIGVSGDGDTASIGIGQFKHLSRRNVPMVYIVENNGVYGLTKGQFSATSEKDLELKHQGVNQYIPIDICMEALIGQATFVARTFAGDPKQVKELLKAALNHNGLAVLDIISPCVTFHNKDEYLHSYMWGRQHELPLHDLAYIPQQEEIVIEEFEEGSVKEVEMHDGSHLYIKKLERDYDPTNKTQAINLLHEAHEEGLMLTGLLYVDTEQETTFELHDLCGKPLNRLTEKELRPAKQELVKLNNSFR